MTTSIVNGGAVIDGAGGGGASLPATPAEALLDAANQGEVVLLAPSTGVGTTLPIEDVVSTGVGILTESPAAAGDFVVGDGAGATQLASAAASAVRAVIGAGNTETDTPQLTSTSGWTVTNYAPGSITVSGGAVTVTVPSGTSSPSGGQVARAWPFPSSVDWEIQARVQITADTDGELLAGIGISWTGGYYTLYLRGNGSFYFYRDGGFGFASQSANGSGLPVDGTLWLRLRGTGAMIQAWRGIGSGSTQPTAWTLVSHFTDTVILGQRGAPNELLLRGFSNNGHTVPSGTTVVWRDVRVRSFDP